jgi:hypothetical protein
MKLASRIWNQRVIGGVNVDFEKLRFRLIGLKPGSGVNASHVQRISHAIYDNLVNTGINIGSLEPDMETVIREIDRYDQYEAYYYRGKEAGQISIVPDECLFVGDVNRVGSDNNTLVVSIRAVIITKDLDGVPSGGRIVPALGGTCYLVRELEPLSLNRRRLDNDYYCIEVTSPLGMTIRNFRLMYNNRLIFPNPYTIENNQILFINNNSVDLDFTNNNSMFIGCEDSSFKITLEESGILEASFSINGRQYNPSKEY